MASFGEELKRERELRDISLKEISEGTKISIRFLEALEQNNFDVLPGGVFNRGFIRAYARFIGVDGEEMVNAYLHEIALKEARQTQAGKGPARPAADLGAPAEPPAGVRLESRAAQRIESRMGGGDGRSEIRLQKRFSARPAQESSEGRTSMALWVLVVLAFLVGVGVITMSFVGGRPVDTTGEGHAQALRARLSKKETTVPIATPPAQAAPAPQEPSDSAEAAAAPPETPAQEGGEPAPAGAATSPQPPAGEPAAQTPRQPGGSAPAPATPAVSEHRLKVRALEATRVSIECGGKLVLDQELWPGQSRTLACEEPIVVSAGNGGALEYTLDQATPALLGDVGQQIDGLTLAPVAPQPAETSGGRSGKEPHAGR